MKTSLISILVVMVATLIALPASATPIFQDDFDNDSGALIGETATTGQTWVKGPWGGADLTCSATYGQGSTVGAGYASNLYTDTTAPLGTTLSTGAYRLDVDIKTSGSAGERGIYVSGSSGRSAALKWDGAASAISFEGFYADPDHPANAAVTIPTGFSGGNIHIAWTFNLTAQTGSVSWYDISDPTNTAHLGNNVNLGAFTNPGTYAMTDILLFISNSGSSGFDNLVLTEVPEPSALILLATGLLCYAWRKRK